MCKTTATNTFFTTRYKYGNNDNEFILCCKGRPFAVLVSPNLPVPTSTLLDYELVKSLGLKLTDLQCRKYSLGGSKYRILGRVTTAVQCVQNGKSMSMVPSPLNTHRASLAELRLTVADTKIDNNTAVMLT